MRWDLDRSPVDACFDYDGACLFRRRQEDDRWLPEMECRTCDRIVGHLVRDQ